MKENINKQQIKIVFQIVFGVFLEYIIPVLVTARSLLYLVDTYETKVRSKMESKSRFKENQ